MKTPIHLVLVALPLYIVTLPLSILSFQLSNVRKFPDS